MKVVAFVPIKLNNERFLGKNLKCFDDGKPLLTYFLERITQIDLIDELYVFCSSEKVKDFLIPKVRFLKRPAYLDSKEATPQHIIQEFIQTIESDIYCVCHCTNPFVRLSHFNETIQAVKSGNFDSSFTAHKIQQLLWRQNNTPLNFDASNIPRTQDLEPLYNEIPAIYAFKKEMFLKYNRRIGFTPHITEVTALESIDIDYPQDFIIANTIYMNRHQLELD